MLQAVDCSGVDRHAHNNQLDACQSPKLAHLAAPSCAVHIRKCVLYSMHSLANISLVDFEINYTCTDDSVVS